MAETKKKHLGEYHIGERGLELFEPLVASILDNYDYTKFDGGLLDINKDNFEDNFIY